jgi:hypothetical protein
MHALRQILSGFWGRSKAAPQSAGNRAPRERSTGFDDEDDYEYPGITISRSITLSSGNLCDNRPHWRPKRGREFLPRKHPIAQEPV